MFLAERFRPRFVYDSRTMENNVTLPRNLAIALALLTVSSASATTRYVAQTAGIIASAFVQRIALISALLVGLSLAATANSVYLSQSGGTFSGGSACNGQSTQAYTYFSNASNWTSGTPTGNQIGPGTTVYICGTISVPQSTSVIIFNFQGAGTSGNPITLKFDTGAVITSPAFYIAIQDYDNYTVVDGGTNGIIQNTANGIGQTYNQGSESVNVAGANITVQNLTIQNICLRNAGDNANACQSGSFGATGISINPFNGTTVSTNILITKNKLVKPGDTGNEYDPYNGDSNITISNNTISGVDWAIVAVSTGSAFSTSGLSITGNELYCAVNAACIWDDPAGSWHHNGVILFPGAVGSGITQTMNGVVIANNYIHDFQSSTSASVCGSAPPSGAGCVTGDIFIDPGYSGSLPGLEIYNNVLESSNCSGGCNGPSNGGIIVGNSNSVSYTAFVYNNTCSDSANGRDCFALDYSGSKGENNISKGSQYGFWSDVTPSGLTVDYNDYYNQSVGQINNGCSGCDTHSVTTNPMLNSDYTLPSGSPARGTGVNLTSLGITGLDTGAPQYFGVNYACGTGCVSRPSTGAWDMGAYPYSTSGSGSGPQPPTGLTAAVQ
jgi:hypothetical protein